MKLCATDANANASATLLLPYVTLRCVTLRIRHSSTFRHSIAVFAGRTQHDETFRACVYSHFRKYSVYLNIIFSNQVVNIVFHRELSLFRYASSANEKTQATDDNRRSRKSTSAVASASGTATATATVSALGVPSFANSEYCHTPPPLLAATLASNFTVNQQVSCADKQPSPTQSSSGGVVRRRPRVGLPRMPAAPLLPKTSPFELSETSAFLSDFWSGFAVEFLRFWRYPGVAIYFIDKGLLKCSHK